MFVNKTFLSKLTYGNNLKTSIVHQTMTTDNYEFRIFDFHIYNKIEEVDSEDDENNKYKPPPQKTFTVQMFGKNVDGKSCSITVCDLNHSST